MAWKIFAEVAARATRRRDARRGINSKNVRRVADKLSNFGFRVNPKRFPIQISSSRTNRAMKDF